MKKLRISLIALVALAASSAMSQEVRFNFDESADFTKFKTYKWVTIKGALPPEGFTNEQIEATFDAELAKKGLTKVDNDTADLFVGYQFGIKSEEKFNSTIEDAEYAVGLPLGAQCAKRNLLFTWENLRSICTKPPNTRGYGEVWPTKPSTSMQNPTPVTSTW